MIKFLLAPLLLIVSITIAYIDVAYNPLFFIIQSGFIIIGDLILPRDYTVYDDKYSSLFNFFVILPLPLLIIYLFISVDGLYDKYLLGDLSLFIIGGNIIQMGLMIGTAGTNAGHELIHRAKKSLHEEFGYWLLALSFDTAL